MARIANDVYISPGRIVSINWRLYYLDFGRLVSSGLVIHGPLPWQSTFLLYLKPKINRRLRLRIRFSRISLTYSKDEVSYFFLEKVDSKIRRYIPMILQLYKLFVQLF